MQMVLSLLRTASSGKTHLEIQNVLKEYNPRQISDIVTVIRRSSGEHSTIEIDSAIFAANDLRLLFGLFILDK